MHISVLLEECLKYLNLKEEDIVVDCTLGYGGHSSNILKRIKKGFLFAFDQDSEAIKSSYQRLKEISDNFEIIQNNFVNIKSELNKRNITEVDSVLYDLDELRDKFISTIKKDFNKSHLNVYEIIKLSYNGLST